MNETSNLFIERTQKTPEVDFNELAGELILSGRSIPENAAKFYEPLLGWISNYIISPRQVTNLRLNLEYYNSTSMIWVAKLVKTLSRINIDDSSLVIHMYIDLEDFEVMDGDEIRSLVGSLVDTVGEAKVSISVKIYGMDEDGSIVKDALILI